MLPASVKHFARFKSVNAAKIIGSRANAPEYWSTAGRSLRLDESWASFGYKTKGEMMRFNVWVSKCLPASTERKGSAGRGMKRVSVALRNPHSGQEAPLSTNQTAFIEFPDPAPCAVVPIRARDPASFLRGSGKVRTFVLFRRRLPLT